MSQELVHIHYQLVSHKVISVPQRTSWLSCCITRKIEKDPSDQFRLCLDKIKEKKDHLNSNSVYECYDWFHPLDPTVQANIVSIENDTVKEVMAILVDRIANHKVNDSIKEHAFNLLSIFLKVDKRLELSVLTFINNNYDNSLNKKSIYLSRKACDYFEVIVKNFEFREKLKSFNSYKRKDAQHKTSSIKNIQTFTRMAINKRSYEKKKGFVKKIQSLLRMRVAMKSYEEKKEAAKTIQSFIQRHKSNETNTQSLFSPFE